VEKDNSKPSEIKNKKISRILKLKSRREGEKYELAVL